MAKKQSKPRIYAEEKKRLLGRQRANTKKQIQTRRSFEKFLAMESVSVKELREGMYDWTYHAIVCAAKATHPQLLPWIGNDYFETISNIRAADLMPILQNDALLIFGEETVFAIAATMLISLNDTEPQFTCQLSPA